MSQTARFYSLILFYFLSAVESSRQTVWTEIGGRAELPCPAQPTVLGDRAVLVLWYRESRTEPVYSYDARNSDFAEGNRWYDESVLGRRAFFKSSASVPVLSIDPVAVSDHGDFSCRVEYIKSPTTTEAFTLFVIIPPGPPSITWNSRPVMEAVGPLQEGQHAELVCTSVGGRPPPSVSWWKGDQKIGAREEVGVSGGGVVEVTSKIRVFGGRELAFVPLRCQAQLHPRGDITIPPRVASVTLNVTLPLFYSLPDTVFQCSSFTHCLTLCCSAPLLLTARHCVAVPLFYSLPDTVFQCSSFTHCLTLCCSAPLLLTARHCVAVPPLQVRIKGGENSANEGSSVRLVCVTSGSHPPAVVTWWKGGNLITSVTQTMEDGGNVTSAAVVMSVTSDDDGTVVTCQAKNYALPSPALTDSLTLSVLYEPRVELLVAEDVTKLREGEATELSCRVKANPPAHLYAWYLNGAPIQQDSISIVRAGLLTLPYVRPEQAGRYTCEATNIIGSTTSNALHITVLHKPRCSKGYLSRSASVARGDSVTLTCRVDAVPASNLAYTWTRLAQDGRETLLPYPAINNGLTSTIEVTPMTVSDYHTLVCRAANSIGRQQEGCQVTLVPSGPPDPPQDCRGEAGAEKGSLVVTCIEGFNGGLPQEFSLLAWQSDTLVANMTSEFPEWGVGGLEEQKGVKVYLWAHNQLGTSDQLTLDIPNIASTQELQDRHRLLKQKDTELFTPGWLPVVLGGVVGTLVLLLIVLLVSVTILHRRRRQSIRRRQDSIKQMMAKNPPDDDEVSTAFTTVDSGDTQKTHIGRQHTDILHLKQGSMQSTRASTPLGAENGSRLHVNPCPESIPHACHSPCGHSCEGSSLLATLQLHHNCAALPVVTTLSVLLCLLLQRSVCYFACCYNAQCAALPVVTTLSVLLCLLLQRSVCCFACCYNAQCAALRVVTTLSVLLCVLLQRSVCCFACCYNAQCVALRVIATLCVALSSFKNMSLQMEICFSQQAEMRPGPSSVCSDTDSDNAVLCSPLIECGASHSPRCQSPALRSPHSACSPAHQTNQCRYVAKHVPACMTVCRDRAHAIRSGSQEAEDSGLEDTVGSAENLSSLGCSRCLVNAPNSDTPRQSHSSPEINIASSASLNKLQQCRLQHSLKRISVDGQSNSGRKRTRRTHFASIHKPTVSHYFDKAKYESFSGESQDSASSDADKKTLYVKSRGTEGVSSDVKILVSPQNAETKAIPLSPCRESEV
ncbi:CD80-like immunoglobulin C2-set [Trinorchestia longiramus]|nr:CD80-like immunoglobulin C2-set [Trinorchestia longiramus]